jgi:hypothetical protein
VVQSPSGEAIMRKRLRDNGLSLTMFGLFLLFLLGHSIAGYYDYNADQHAHQQPAVHYGAYLTSAHFWGAVFENWESEFLQMAAYVFLTVFLFQDQRAHLNNNDNHFIIALMTSTVLCKALTRKSMKVLRFQENHFA